MKRLLTLAALLCCSMGHAQVYNILDSFNNNSPTNGPWQLGFRYGMGGTAFQLMNTFNTLPFANGSAAHWTSTPHEGAAFGFYRNTNDFTLNGNDLAQTRIPPNDWMIHPEFAPGIAMNVDPVCRFTPPVAGIYRIDYSIARLSQFSGDSRVLVLRNGTVLDSALVTSDGYMYHPRPRIVLNLALSNFLDFEVHTNGSTSGDATGIRATITRVYAPTQLTISPGTVFAGVNPTATVTMGGPSPSGGQVVSVASSNPFVVAIPASVTVPEGATSTSFPITTHHVASQTTITLSASANGTTKTAQLTIKPNVLTDFTATPSTVTSGGTTVGRVFISAPAPAGTAAQITSGSTAFVFSPSVPFLTGRTSAPFVIRTQPVTTTVIRAITATYTGVSKTIMITLTPSPTLLSLTANFTTINGGAYTDAQVTLSQAAPTGGIIIPLTSSHVRIVVPSSVTVPAGSTVGTFRIVGVSGAGTITGQVTAKHAGVTKTVTITVKN